MKTFGPRGTVHLLATADLPMWTGALSALPSSVPGFPEPIRFTPEETEAVIAGIGAALADAELTIDELTAALRERVGPWAVEENMPAFQVLWPRWRQLTSTAAHRGVLCFGHDRGRHVTYTNPHRWLPGFVPVDGATALRTLVRDYLHAYGPATPQHFAKWLNVPPRRAVELFEGMADELERVELEGTPAWVVAGDVSVPGAAVTGIRLLPYFDAYVVAAQPRERLYPGAAGTRALSPSGQAGNYPVMLVDGVVGGVWHQKRTGRRITITVEPLVPLTAAQRRAARGRGRARRHGHGGRPDAGHRRGDGRSPRLRRLSWRARTGWPAPNEDRRAGPARGGRGRPSGGAARRGSGWCGRYSASA